MKPFKSISEQAEILRSRGLIIPEGHDVFLRLSNYYVVINGYNDLFLKSVHPEEYLEDTSIEEVFQAHEFDRELRSFLLPWIMRIEDRLKVVIAHKASEYFKHNQEFYLKLSSYDSSSKNIAHSRKTIRHLRRQYNKEHPSLNHYRRVHHSIPFWVLINWVTFGELSHFYALLKPRGVKEAIVKELKHFGSPQDEKLTVERLGAYIRVLADFRNVCAHSERCYCHRHKSIVLDGKSKASVASLIKIITSFLSEYEKERFDEQYSELFEVFFEESIIREEIIAKIVVAMGFSNSGETELVVRHIRQSSGDN